MRYIIALLAICLLCFVASAPAVASPEAPVLVIGATDTRPALGFGVDIYSLDLGARLKMPAKTLWLNFGPVVQQEHIDDWSRYSTGALINLEWRGLAAGVAYDWGRGDWRGTIGWKIGL